MFYVFVSDKEKEKTERRGQRVEGWMGLVMAMVRDGSGIAGSGEKEMKHERSLDPPWIYRGFLVDLS